MNVTLGNTHELEKENLRKELEAKNFRDQDSIRRAKDEERKEALQEQAIKHEQTLKTLQKGVGILEQGSQQIQVRYSKIKSRTSWKIDIH